MDLRRALTLFRLNDHFKYEELVFAFRELVKKYHPDKVREYPEWAHERMSEINDAYEVLAEWMNRRTAEQTPEPPADESGHPAEPDRNDGRDHPSGRVDTGPGRRVSPLSPAEASDLARLFKSFLDGLGTYYQYGLNKPSYREEGVRRFRFRESYRVMSSAMRAIEDYSRRCPHPVIRATHRFVRLTLAEIDLGNPRFENQGRYRKYDAEMLEARRAFDEAVKEYFFPELIPEHLRGRSAAGLYTSYTTFVLYLTMFSENERRDVGILMTARHDAFMDLLVLKRSGVVPF